MTLVKWTPKRDMLNIFDDVDQMISQAFSYSLGNEHELWSFSPLMNVNESDLEYTVYMDLPGVDKKDVEVNMSEGVITVTGMRKNSQQRKNNSCIWQENSQGTFIRSFELTKSVQENQIKARYKNGVLILTIPKAEKVDPPVKNIAVS